MTTVPLAARPRSIATPRGALTAARAFVAEVPFAFSAAFLALLADLADTALFPSDNATSRSLQAGGVRLSDVLALLSLIATAGALASGRLRIPPSLGIPFLLTSWVWAIGLVTGLEKHAPLKTIFAECHVLLYVAALGLAYLQVPHSLVRKVELVLAPAATLGVLLVLPRGGFEKGGDISTIGAGIATVLLVRNRLLVGLPVAVVSFALLATGGQRASLLFAGPPLLLALVIAVRRTRPTNAGVVVVGLVVAAAGAAAGSLATTIGDQFHKTFGSTAKAQSGSSRLDQLHIAEHAISQSPVFGQGLGFRYQLFDNNGSNATVLTDVTHDIYVDVTLRFGFAGAAVLACVLLLGVLQLARYWSRLTTYRVVLVLLVASLLAHGAVESILDKPRLTVFMGWLAALLLTSPGPGDDPSPTVRPAAVPRGDVQQV